MSEDRSTVPRFRRILLTGGGGFVGGYLCPRLVQAMPGAERLLLRRPGSSQRRPGWEIAEADIFDRAAMSAIVENFRPDLVIHLAAQSSVASSGEAAEGTWRVNLDGSVALASACARAAPRTTFFFVSSAEVYGLSFRDGPVTEESPLWPTNPYARSKAAAEQVIADVLPQESQLIVARSFNHTGPGQDERFVLPSFAAQVARIEAGRQSAMKVGNIYVERDFLDVRDICDAYVGLIEAAPGLPNRSVFNVSSGSARPLSEILEKLQSMARVRFNISLDRERIRSVDIRSVVGINERLKSRIAWSAAHSIDETLDSLLRYARDNLR